MPREGRGIRPHLDRCALCRERVENLRAAGDWLRSVSGESQECLSVEGMAAILDGKISSRHVEFCPRCAAEFKKGRTS